MAKKQVTAQQAYGKWAEAKASGKKAPQSLIINSCPDCIGTGKINGKRCPTCGGERD